MSAALRLFVLGGTGRTGAQLIDQALARGHRVSALARSPEKLDRPRDGLTVMKGDPHDADAIAAVLPGHDAVLSALGPRPREALTRTALLRSCAASALDAMRRAGVTRYVVVSSALLFPGGGPLFTLSRLLLRPHVRDLREMEERVTRSALAWTIARPPRLIATDEDGYRAEEGELPSPGTVLSWRAVAAFMLDAVEHGRHVQKIVGISR